jgi:hypothetical protein
VSLPVARDCPVAPARSAKPPPRPSPPSAAKEYRDEAGTEAETQQKVSVYCNSRDTKRWDKHASLYTSYYRRRLTVWSWFCLSQPVVPWLVKNLLYFMFQVEGYNTGCFKKNDLISNNCI